MNDTIEVTHDGSTVEVPREFDSGDLTSWTGSVPFPITVDRVFAYDGVRRAEDLSGDNVVEVGRFTDDDLKSGWKAAEVSLASDEAAEVEIGETLWVRDDEVYA